MESLDLASQRPLCSVSLLVILWPVARLDPVHQQVCCLHLRQEVPLLCQLVNDESRYNIENKILQTHLMKIWICFNKQCPRLPASGLHAHLHCLIAKVLAIKVQTDVASVESSILATPKMTGVIIFIILIGGLAVSMIVTPWKQLLRPVRRLFKKHHLFSLCKAQQVQKYIFWMLHASENWDISRLA